MGHPGSGASGIPPECELVKLFQVVRVLVFVQGRFIIGAFIRLVSERLLCCGGAAAEKIRLHNAWRAGRPTNAGAVANIWKGIS